MRNAVHKERTFRPPSFIQKFQLCGHHSIVFSIVLQMTFQLKQSQLFVYDNCQKTWAVFKHNKYFQSFPISKKKLQLIYGPLKCCLHIAMFSGRRGKYFVMLSLDVICWLTYSRMLQAILSQICIILLFLYVILDLIYATNCLILENRQSSKKFVRIFKTFSLKSGYSKIPRAE